MGNLDFAELDILVQGFCVAASTGIFLGFSVWVVRLIIKVFRMFFTK